MLFYTITFSLDTNKHGDSTMTLIETERLTLRQLTLTDAPFIFTLLREPSFKENIADKNIQTHEDAEKYIQTVPMKTYETYDFGLYLTTLKDRSIPIGICGLVKRDSLDAPDIGFAFLSQYFGNGYATEAASAAIEYERKKHKLPRILAITSLTNNASARVLEKIGFTFHSLIEIAGYEEKSRFYTHKDNVE